MGDIDQATLHFSPAGLTALNVVLGLVMFGIALDLKIEHFRSVLRTPREPIVGVLAQFLLLPAFTWVLTRLLDVQPSIALGMILVAACPGGNVSNFITHLSKGSTALSVGLSAVSTVGALFMTPLNLALWGSLSPGTAAILTKVHLDPLSMLGTVSLILGLPMLLGMLVGARAPKVALRLRKPFKILSLGFFVVFIVIALRINADHFKAAAGLVVVPVAIHNALALTVGYLASRVGRLREGATRAVTIGVGIQNSALGLILVFEFFDGLGGMAVIAAWWGVWHIIAGLALAAFWSRRPPPEYTAEVTP